MTPAFAASETMSSAGVDPHVVGREFVSPNAVRLAGVDGRHAVATAIVFGSGHCFQMLRIDTCAVPAQMVDLQSDSDLSVCVDVRSSMGTFLFASAWVVVVGIAACSNDACPVPAPGYRIDIVENAEWLPSPDLGCVPASESEGLAFDPSLLLVGLRSNPNREAASTFA